MTVTAPPLLEMQGIGKHFSGVVALDGVDLSVTRGSVHALIGQNGAGKSTLMKILAGVYAADAGTIRIEGIPVHFTHPRDALRQGIGVVYQDLSLVAKLTVADNILLGREPGGILIDQRAILERASEILERLGVTGIDLRARLDSLSLAQQQLVEIAKVLSHEPRILVLDEPTAALAEEETELLFRAVARLREQGIGTVYISHRFKEILRLCDQATVLRNGRLVKTLALDGVSEETLVELTLGEKIEQFFRWTAESPDGQRQVALEVEDFAVGRQVRKVSFALQRGEIVGVTGLLGAGQNALGRALFGLMPEVSGVVRVGGRPVLITSPRRAIDLGIGLLTEHRKTEGLVLDMSVRENITLPSLRNFRRWLLFHRLGKERLAADQYREQLHIKTPSTGERVSNLSGGNQQKVILGKWLLRDLDVLIFIAPTQGIDVGAKAEIYEQLRALATEGKAILVISEELVEILGISDRIIVMDHGRIGRIFTHSEATEESLTAVMQGQAEAVNDDANG